MKDTKSFMRCFQVYVFLKMGICLDWIKINIALYLNKKLYAKKSGKSRKAQLTWVLEAKDVLVKYV